jgi:hypothetical protein
MTTFTFDKVNKLIIIPRSWYEVNDYQVTIQQLINDIRDFEDNFEGMDIPRIADGAGKQDLGGGVLVGISLTLYDWKVQFQGRLDTTWVTCTVTGGNLVCYDTTAEEYIFPLEPSAYVMATITASSSATLQELSAIQFSSFDGGVWINQVSGDSGTDYPAGTPQQPVDNITDAKSIADDRGFTTFYIIGNLTVTASDDITDYTLIGASQDKTTIYLENGCTVDNCEFESAAISGSLGGSVVNFFDCRLNYTVDGLVNGYMRNCILGGTLKISGTTGEVVDILSCYSGVPGSATPFIDFQGTYSQLGMRDYAGGITILNMTNNSSNISMDFLSGHGKIDSTCTSGTVVVRGTAKCTDNSGPNCSVDKTQLRVPESDFQGYISIDIDNGASGTAFPLGTLTYPVNNLGNARAIADTYGLKRLYINGTITLDQEYNNWLFEGDSPEVGGVIFNNQSTEGSLFGHLTLSGQCSSSIHAHGCKLNYITNIEGEFIECIIASELDCKDDVWTYIWDSASIGSSSFPIYMNSGAKVGIQNCTLVCSPRDMKKDTAIFLKHGQGGCIMHSSNISGTIRLGGESSLYGSPAVGISFLDDTTRHVVWEEPLTDHTTSNTFGSGLAFIHNIEGGRWHRSGTQMIFYDSSGTTEIARFDLKQSDGSAATESDDVFERVRV